jgi:outer membrane protein assembly factor BamE (lipoprotein component of BamABCDE complex)
MQMISNAQVEGCISVGTTSNNQNQTMKKTPVISLLVSAALLGVCGCASDSGQQSQQQTQQPAQPKPAKDTRPIEDRVTVGMSKDDVTQAIGKPKNVSVSSDGTEVWMYNDAQNAFIPFYRLSGGQFHTLTVIFDATVKVKSKSSSTSGGF